MILPDWDDALPVIGGPLVFDEAKNDAGAYILNDFTADHLNTAARFAFKRAEFLGDLAEQGEAVVFSVKDLQRLADDFGQIGFHVGDGVLFDADQTPASSEEGQSNG